MKYWRMRTEKEENIHYSGIDEENNMIKSCKTVSVRVYCCKAASNEVRRKCR
jgi:hypothetical protein